MFKKCFKILLGGFKAAQSSPPVLSAGETSTNQHDWAGKPKAQRSRNLLSAFSFQLSAILLLLSLTGCRIGNAYFTVTNEASLSYSNAAQVYYYTDIDTAELVIYSGPLMRITKLTKNLMTGEEGSNTHTIHMAPGDTAEITLMARNTGDTASYWITVIDTFPDEVGDSTTNNTGMSYVSGSETCAINGSLAADSISWCTDDAHSWNAFVTYNETVSRSIPATCTGIRWRWNRIDIAPEQESWIRIKYQWLRNKN